MIEYPLNPFGCQHYRQSLFTLSLYGLPPIPDIFLQHIAKEEQNGIEGYILRGFCNLALDGKMG